MTKVAQGQNYVGAYRLLRMIRAGKACQIWEAVRELENERCVLKILRKEFWNDRDEVGLLKHEYFVGKDLDHEHVIRIYEFDIVRGTPFLALESFESLNLKQWLRENPEPDRALLASLIEQSALGLEHLHSHGWVHRDVKPDNLLVNSEGLVKLIDFAIAQKMRSGLGRLFGGKGKIQGTRSYMAPEQIRNEAIDFRADVYSFGCTIFELISGKLPFTGINADDLLQRHLKSPVPSLMALDHKVTEEMSNLVGRMMAKRREERPASMTEFLAAFRAMRLPLERRR